jgi:hypothetical protein
MILKISNFNVNYLRPPPKKTKRERRARQPKNSKAEALAWWSKNLKPRATAARTAEKI